MGDISRDAVRPTEGGSLAEPSAVVLYPLADELLAIAARLRDAASPAPDEEAKERTKARGGNPSRGHLALARKTYALRRKREAIFGNPDLLANRHGTSFWTSSSLMRKANRSRCRAPVSVQLHRQQPACAGLVCWRMKALCCAKMMLTTIAASWCVCPPPGSQRCNVFSTQCRILGDNPG